MSERQTLLLVLALIYLSECVLWVRRGGVLFRRGWSAWSVRTESEAIRNDRGDLHWTWPLPPFGDAFVAHGIPLAVGPGGVMNFTAAGLHPAGRPLVAPRFIRWEELKDIHVSGKILRLNGEEFWRGDTIHEPLRLGRMLNELRKLDAPAREGGIRGRIAESFDGAAIRKRMEEAEKATRNLRTAGMVLFAVLFAVSPAAILKKGWISLLLIVPCVLILMGVIAWMIRGAHRRLHPDGGDERFRFVLMTALSPVAGIRASDTVQRAALEGFHPVAVAAALLPKERFASFAESAWRDLKFPRLPENPITDEASVVTGRWYSEALASEYAKAIRGAGLDPDDFEKPPVKTDPTHARYCPRCRSQFTAAAAECRQCGGRPLVSFDPET